MFVAVVLLLAVQTPLPEATLAVTLPPGCPSADDVRGGVAARLGRDPFVANAPDGLRVVGSVERDLLVVQIQASSDGAVVGERTVQGPANACGELTAQVELALAVMLDPLYSPFRPRTPDPAGVLDLPDLPDPPAPAPPKPETFVVQAPPRRRPPAPAWLAGAGLFGAVGRQPALGVGLRGSVGVQQPFELGPIDHIGLAVELHGTLPLPAPVAGGSVGGQSTALALLPCVRMGLSELCGVADGGALIAFGAGLADSTSAVLPSAAAGGRLGVVWPITESLFLTAHADVLVPLVHHVLHASADPTRVYFESWPVVPAVAFGVRGALAGSAPVKDPTAGSQDPVGELDRP